MRLGFLTEEAYDTLLDNCADNVHYYESNEKNWIARVLDNENYYKFSSVNVNEADLYYVKGKKTDEQKCNEDLSNSRILFEAFQNLTPYQASNIYMWSYLCHTPKYLDYIHDRWMLDTRENTERASTIRTRYFVTKSERSLRENALSRLWWAAYLTVDPNNKKNKFELTNILFMHQTILKDVLDTLNRTSKNRIKGVLMAINEYPEKRGIIDRFRYAAKRLNNYAAVTIMDCLEADEIRDLTLSFMREYKKQ